MKVTCQKCRGSFEAASGEENDSQVNCPYCGTEISSSTEEGEVAENNGTFSELTLSEGQNEAAASFADQSSIGDEKKELDDLIASPLGVRFIAATFGLLGLLYAANIMVQFMLGRIIAPVLFPLYITIGVSLFIALLMYFLYHLHELARKLTILLCIISLLNSARTIFQIVQLAHELPWGELINYFLRIIFSLYFMLYLLTPRVKAAFILKRR